MRKISLLKFTICLPFVAAIICAVYVAYTASVREQAAIHFQQSVDGKTSSKYSTGVNQLVAAYGQIEAAKIVEAMAKTVDTIAFDGVSRFAKIVHRTKEWTGIDPSRTGYSDGVVLEDLEHKTGAV